MRLMSWNLNKRPGAWSYVLDQVRPDLCFFQEFSKAMEGSTPKGYSVISSWFPPGRFGVGIGSDTLSLSNFGFSEFPGRVLVADIGKKLLLANIHVNLISDSYPQQLNLMLDRLEPLIFENKDRLIIGGDLNTGLWVDKKYRTKENKAVLDRLVGYGLVKFPEPEAPTHYHYGRDSPFPVDFLFASPSLNPRNFQILEDSRIRELSDHLPIVLDFDFPK